MVCRNNSHQQSSIRRALLWILTVFVFSVIMVRAVIQSPQSSELSSVLSEGRRQYELIKEKSNLPDSGQCWRNAVSRLHNGCRHLTESLQTELALRFADCFMKGSGHPGIECINADAESDTDSFTRQSCLRNLTDRVFLTYTEFYTHSQSMCLFLMSQVWHQETQKTIDKLWSSASDVSKQLEEAGKIQETLLDGQKESIGLQQTLLDNSHQLGHLIHESANTLSIVFKEFRSTAAEQQQLLSQVFRHLSALQSWVVGEVSWVDSLVFYISTSFIAYLVTSARRVSDARFPLFIVLLLSAAAERLLANFILSETDDHDSVVLISTLKEELYWWLWILRRVSVLVCGIVLMITFYRYADQEEQRHQLLLQISSQNKEMITFLRDKMLNRGLINAYDVPDSVGYTAVSVSPVKEATQLRDANTSITGLTTVDRSSPTHDTVMEYSHNQGASNLEAGTITPKSVTPTARGSPQQNIASGNMNSDRKEVLGSFDRSSHSMESTPQSFASDLQSVLSDTSEVSQNTIGTSVKSVKKTTRGRSRSRKRTPGGSFLSPVSVRPTPYNLRRAVASAAL